MPEATEASMSFKHGRGLTGFYAAIGVVVALGLLGAWVWKAWTVW